VDDVFGSGVGLLLVDSADAADVESGGDHGLESDVELDELLDLVLLEVELEGVVDGDVGVGLADGAAVVGDDLGHAVEAGADLLDLEQLVVDFLVGDLVHDLLALGVLEHAELVVGLLDGEHVHEAQGEAHVGACAVVDLDQALDADGLGLTLRQRLLELVSQHNYHRDRLAQSVGGSRRAWSLNSTQFF